MADDETPTPDPDKQITLVALVATCQCGFSASVSYLSGDEKLMETMIDHVGYRASHPMEPQ